MGLHLLVADDSAVLRHAVVRLLERREEVSSIVVAEDGDQALAALRREHFDACVLDFEMPGRTGVEVLRDAEGCRPPALLLTASLTPALDAEARAVGFGATMHKDRLGDAVADAVVALAV